jgi:hypothetical protein
MKRDTVINVLLIIAGIVLAIALFGAGVLYKSRAATKTSGFVNSNASETANHR